MWWRSSPSSRVLAVAAMLAMAGASGLRQPDRGVEARGQSTETLDQDGGRRPDFAAQQRQQAATDLAWREASAGSMRMEKIRYRSGAGDMDIPAFVFHPLGVSGPRSHPALVWVHENIRGHLYEHYIPYIREATAQGYVVIAPEYRGSIGYGAAFYDAIDYGGAEVDDVTAAVRVLEGYPHVDPARIGIVGWSHGGMIALLAIFRQPTLFKAAATIAPVTNLFHRLAQKGVERQRQAIDPQNRFGGTPAERPDVYRARSPLFHVDNLRIPLLVHLAGNDEDVTIDEGMQLLDALQARKPYLVETKIYPAPLGGHTFDRQIDPATGQPRNTPDQVDSWRRVWAFLDEHLRRTSDLAGASGLASRPLAVAER
jgi:dipeptidyl aminopeptidase/acylaminoacyl peptidase